jgi:UDP-N-acetylglucosamine:LPS N-acetylglucosamine transferase
VINQRIELADDMRGNTHFIVHSERDWKLIVNLWEAFRILYRERPSVILSTGAGPAVPFALVGRVLFGCRVVFIESITRVTGPSLTGRIMYLLAHDFFYQWQPLQRFFPRAKYGGPLL